VAALLSAAGLPTEDLTEAHMDAFFYAGAADAPVGVVGLELYGSHALLRSLVVAQTARAAGLGMALVNYAEQQARTKGVRSLFLLTNTAEKFFRRLGYENVDRGLAPDAIRATREFSSLCPSSSAFMVKHLG
jgi:amino-acid N-acetyltransferase